MHQKLNYYQLRKACYNYKAFYIVPMVTTKEISIKDTQKKVSKQSMSVQKKKREREKDRKTGTKQL